MSTLKTAEHYIRDLGIPVALVAFGAYIFGSSFWLGFFAFFAGITLLLRGMKKESFYKKSPIARRVSWAVYVTLCVVSLWYSFRPMRVEQFASSTLVNYGPGTEIGGIYWKPEFSEFHLNLRNDSETAYEDFDAAITTDLSIKALKEIHGISSCSVGPSDPQFDATVQPEIGGVPVGPAVTNNNDYAVVALDKDGVPIRISGGISKTYRFHCDKFLPGDEQSFVGALVVLNPFVNGKAPARLYAYPKPASWVSTRSKFKASGRDHNADITECRMEVSCKSF